MLRNASTDETATMTTPRARAERFHALHVRGEPLVLFNAWDAGSAKAVAHAGARAIATGSWSVAAAHGFDDGEALPLELALANLARIVRCVDLPVTLDFEGGYAVEPAALAANARRAIDAGAIGFNFEDQVVGGTGRHPVEVQAKRIRAIRDAADAAGVPVFINARADVFLQDGTHDAAMVDRALECARAWADAGASGLFVPGLADEALIARACEGSPLPVNVMASPKTPPKARLAALGVARISHGPGPYRLAMRALEAAAREALA